jgi:hypothetical protein
MSRPDVVPLVDLDRFDIPIAGRPALHENVAWYATSDYP